MPDPPRPACMATSSFAQIVGGPPQIRSRMARNGHGPCHVQPNGQGLTSSNHHRRPSSHLRLDPRTGCLTHGIRDLAQHVLEAVQVDAALSSRPPGCGTRWVAKVRSACRAAHIAAPAALAACRPDCRGHPRRWPRHGHGDRCRRWSTSLEMAPIRGVCEGGPAPNSAAKDQRLNVRARQVEANPPALARAPHWLPRHGFDDRLCGRCRDDSVQRQTRTLE